MTREREEMLQMFTALGMDHTLERDGEIAIDVETFGYRSGFIGAVLATLPTAAVLPTSPPRISLRRQAP